MKIGVFDYIIITVSNQKQKMYLEENIKERKEKGLIPNTCYIIIEEKEKIGSGGAILNLIKFFEIKNKNVFKENKCLLINSAGDSKRMILNADNGKISINTFKEIEENIDSIILDDIIEETEPIGKAIKSGLLVVSGDCVTIYDDFKFNQIRNNTAISIKTNVKVGQNHGVFLEENGVLKESLQKNTEEELREKGAVDEEDNVNLDTGMIFFTVEFMENLRKIITTNDILDEEKFKKIVNSKVRLNMYTDFIYPLSTNANLDTYLKQKAEVEINQELIYARKQLWRALNSMSLDILPITNARFIHYGTVREYIDRAFEIFQKPYIILDSNISKNSKIGKKCYIEKSTIENSVIGENTIILNTKIINKNIPENIIVKTVKLDEHKYITIIIGINDDLKERDYKKIKLFNTEIGEKIRKENIINDVDKTLWECKLYPIAESKEKSFEETFKLYNNFKIGNYHMENKDRLSIKEIMINFRDCT